MDILLNNFDGFALGFWISVKLIFVGLIGALILGTLIAVCRVSPIPPLRLFGAWWVNTFRNTPLTLVAFFAAFGLPVLGIRMDYFWFMAIALWVYTSAFVCEAIRAGINAVQPGQAEAARAIGLTFGQTLSLVVMPQAFRAIVPPLGSVLIAMMKNSAIAGLFGVPNDLMNHAEILIGSRGEPAMTVLLWTLVGYWLITLTSGAALAAIEKKLEVAR